MWKHEKKDIQIREVVLEKLVPALQSVVLKKKYGVAERKREVYASGKRKSIIKDREF